MTNQLERQARLPDAAWSRDCRGGAVALNRAPPQLGQIRQLGVAAEQRQPRPRPARQLRRKIDSQRVERGILTQDRVVQATQVRPGFHADLLHERGPCAAVGLQGLRLTSRAVKREHPLGMQSLKQRLLRHECLEFREDLAMPPRVEVLAIGHYGGAVRLVSTTSWKPMGRRLDGHRARVTALEFAPDGRVLATGSADGTVRLWDAATQQPIGSPLTIAADAYVAATFARDGSHLFAVPHEGRGVRWDIRPRRVAPVRSPSRGPRVRWDIRPESWTRHACLVAGRELSPRE
jgi:WD domain, G-beta repeat